MTEEEAESVRRVVEQLNGSRATNDVLRRRLEGSEKRIHELEAATREHDELRSEFMLKAERLTQCLAVLEAAGLIDKLPPVPAPGERLRENDARTPTQVRE